jgi:hypothetical protein
MKLVTRNWMRGTGVAFAAVLGLGLGAAPAYATDGDPTSDTEACWSNYDTGEFRCFENFDAFVAEVEAEGGVLLEAGDPPPAARDGVTPFALYSLVTLYADASLGGASTTSTTSISTTCSTHSFTYNAMLSGWNDRVSSFLSYGPCKTRLSENINQGGSSFGPVASANSLGVMNDAASSYWVTG